MQPTISEFHNEWGNGRMLLSPFMDSHGRKYCFGISVSLDQVNSHIQKDIRFSALIGLLILMVLFPSIYLLAKSISDPIKLITTTADNIAKGQNAVPLPKNLKNWQEINSLNNSILAMDTQIQNKIDALEEAKIKLEKNEESLRNQNIQLDKIITERTEEYVQAKQTAEKSELQFKQLFDNMEQGFALHEMIYDPSGKPIDYRFILINNAFERQTGLNKKDIIGKTVKDVLPNTEQVWIDNYGEVAKTGIPFRFNNFSQELEKYYNVVAYSPKTNFFAVIFSDITKLKKSEIELVKAKDRAEESEKQLKRIANNFVDGMIYQVAMIDENKRKFNYVSDAVLKLYGCTPDQAKEDPSLIYGKLHPDDAPRLIETEKEALRSMSIFRTECRVINPDGSIRWSYYVSQPSISNGIVCWDGIEVDITKQKQIEDELIKAKEEAEISNRLKTEFISNMSHEIRTPMNGIIGFSNFLDDNTLSPQKRKYYAGIVKNCSHQLLHIIDDIIEISKLGTKKVKLYEREICLNDLLLEQFSIFDVKAKERKIPLYLKKGLSDPASTVVIDDSKLIKVISNLLENALKFTENGSVELGYTMKGDTIELYIKDTGIGISKDKQQLIFERFLQEERDISKNIGGLGLGLSIAKENTELLGGTITLQSEKGIGSTFFITIPYNPAKNQEDLSKVNRNLSTQKTITIMIAEDEEVNYLFLETLILEKLQLRCTLYHAKNGQEAIDLSRQHAEIDCILMDIKMPVKNGFEATKEIKSFRPTLPIIAQSAYTSKEDTEKAELAGCDDIITKPIEEDILHHKLKTFLPQSEPN